ncbi:hypothetical protein MNV49_007649 [Pseudohyphozyma bogoriensis]|nr:hypothetical protein MNV49_007649 [Pseudohyphozyma bogoriensis]
MNYYAHQKQLSHTRASAAHLASSAALPVARSAPPFASSNSGDNRKRPRNHGTARDQESTDIPVDPSLLFPTPSPTDANPSAGAGGGDGTLQGGKKRKAPRVDTGDLLVDGGHKGVVGSENGWPEGAPNGQDSQKRASSCQNCRKRTWPTCLGCAMRDEPCSWQGVRVPPLSVLPTSLHSYKPPAPAPPPEHIIPPAPKIDEPSIGEQLKHLRMVVEVLVERCEGLEMAMGGALPPPGAYMQVMTPAGPMMQPVGIPSGYQQVPAGYPGFHQVQAPQQYMSVAPPPAPAPQPHKLPTPTTTSSSPFPSFSAGHPQPSPQRRRSSLSHSIRVTTTPASVPSPGASTAAPAQVAQLVGPDGQVYTFNPTQWGMSPTSSPETSMGMSMGMSVPIHVSSGLAVPVSMPMAMVPPSPIHPSPISPGIFAGWGGMPFSPVTNSFGGFMSPTRRPSLAFSFGGFGAGGGGLGRVEEDEEDA